MADRSCVQIFVQTRPLFGILVYIIDPIDIIQYIYDKSIKKFSLVGSSRPEKYFCRWPCVQNYIRKKFQLFSILLSSTKIYTNSMRSSLIVTTRLFTCLQHRHYKYVMSMVYRMEIIGLNKLFKKTRGCVWRRIFVFCSGNELSRFNVTSRQKYSYYTEPQIQIINKTANCSCIDTPCGCITQISILYYVLQISVLYNDCALIWRQLVNS